MTKCKSCHKKLLPVTANGSLRTYKLGYYCPKCKRFVPDKNKIKESQELEGEL